MLKSVNRKPTSSGPLDGVRLAVKELIGIGGHELSANTPVPLPDRWKHPEEDSTIVARLRSAGAEVVGTTTTHEFAWGITTHDRGRRVENPRQSGRIAGGSSGGSAEAIVLGEADLAIGTDTAGSVRIPAAWCHLVGWKFSDGLVPMDGILPLAPGLDHVGLLAEDPLVLLKAADALGADAKGEKPRIGTLPIGRLASVDSRAVSVIEEALETLVENHGFERIEVADFPSVQDLLTCFTIIQGAATLQAHSELIGTWPAHQDLYPEYIQERLTAAAARSPKEVASAQQLQAQLRLQLNRITDGCLVLMPATGCGPPSTETPNVCMVNNNPTDLRSVVIPNTVPANISGLPAVTVPFTSDGEEFGVQLLGAMNTDRTLLSLAQSVMDPSSNSPS